MADTILLSDIDGASVPVTENNPISYDAVESGRRIRLDDNIDFVSTFEIPIEKKLEWQQKGQIGLFESFSREGGASLFPFINPEKAARTVNVMSAMNRLRDNNYGEDTLQKATDEKTFSDFTLSLAEEQYRGYTWQGKVAQGVSALPAFMFEFYATGGAASVGKTAAQKVLTQAVGKFAANRAVNLGIRVAGTAAGAVARTPIASGGRIAQEFADRQINSSLTFTDTGVKLAKEAQEKPFTSLMKAAGNRLIENFSETIGGAIGRGVQHVFGQKLGVAMSQLWTKLHPNENVAKLFTKAGYNDFIGELGEERLGDVLRAVTGVSDFGAGDNASVLDKVVASIPSGEEFLVEAAVLAVPGAAHLGWQGMVSKLQKDKGITPEQSPYGKEVPSEVLTPLQVANLTKDILPTNAQAEAAPEGLSAVEFKPKESDRPTFEQRAKEVLGESVSRVDVAASIQDEKVKASLFQLDEQATQIDQTLTYLEKRQAKLQKSGKDPLAEAGISKLIEEQKKQFDLVDSQRGDILTSLKEDINFEKQSLKFTGKKVTDIALKQTIAGFKSGVKAGRKITQEMFVETQKALREFLATTELNPNEKGRFLSKREIDSIDTPQKLTSKLDKIEERITEIVDQRKAREAKAKIIDILASTKTRTEAGKPIGKYTPEIQVILDKAREISNLTREQARIRLEHNLKSVGDEQPSDEMRLENRLLDTMAGLNKRNPAELSQILRDLDALISTGQAESLLRSFSRKEKQAQDKEKGLAVLTGHQPLDETSKDSFLKTWDRRFRMAGKSLSSSWDNLLNQLSSYDKTSKTDKSFLSDRFNVIQIEIQERSSIQNLVQDVVTKGIANYGFKTEFQFAKQMHKDISEEYSEVFKFADGITRRLTLTKAQMRKRYMEFQDPTLLRVLYQPEGNAYTPDIANWIGSFLTKEDKAFANTQLQFYRDYYAIVNDVYKRQYGVNLPFNEFYSPIRRDIDKDIVDNPLKQEADLYASFVPGSFKARVENLNPLKDMNDWEVLNRHIIQMEHFRHWADTLRDMNAFFSDGTVRKTIKKQFGSDVLNIIDSYIKDFKSRGRRNIESWEKWVDYMRTGKVVFALGGKVAQIPKQLTGMFGYMEFVSPKEWVSGMVDFVAHAPSAIKTLSDSPMIQLMDGNITQEFIGLLSSEDAKRFVNTPNIKYAMNLWMGAVRFGAKAGNMIGGWAVYKTTLDKTGSAEKAMQAFEAALVKTQPTSLLSSLSEWQRGNALQRLTSMFMSAQNKYFQRELSAIRDAIYGRATPQELAKVIFIHHVIIPTLFQWVANGFKWDDEEQIRAALTGPLNGVFILGDMFDSIIRTLLNEAAEFDLAIYTPGNQLMEPVVGVRDAIRDLNLEDMDLESIGEAIKTLSTQTIGPVTGLPTKLIFDVIPKGISDIVENDEVVRGLLKLGGWAPAHIDKIYDK